MNPANTAAKKLVSNASRRATTPFSAAFHGRGHLTAWLFAALCAAGTTGLSAVNRVRHEVAFSDLPRYTTLRCDFHMHTVFSDGLVWPTLRVEEAWRDGLDVIAITDHSEYQRFKDDVPPKIGRSYELALQAARGLGLQAPLQVELAPEAITAVEFSRTEQATLGARDITLPCLVTNALTAPAQPVRIELNLPVQVDP